MLLERTRIRNSFSISHAKRLRRARKHDKQELFLRRREEDPVRHACVWRELQARLSKMSRNASWEVNKNTPFVVIVHIENKRWTRSQWTGIIIKRTIRRLCLSCSLVDRTRGTGEHDGQDFFLSSMSLSLHFTPPPLQFSRWTPNDITPTRLYFRNWENVSASLQPLAERL